MKIRIIKQSIFTLLTLSLLMSCGMNQDKGVSENNDAPKDKYLELRKDFEYVNFIPDSLRTPEQNGLVLLLIKTTQENIKVENKRFVLKLTKEEMVDFGLPEPYYEVLLNNVTDLNLMMNNTEDTVAAKFYKGWEKDVERMKMETDSMEADWIKSGKAIKYRK